MIKPCCEYLSVQCIWLYKHPLLIHSETCAWHDKDIESVYRLKLEFFGGSLEKYFDLFPVYY